jgi:diguanylate cyclase (GGDEF)-like protein
MPATADTTAAVSPTPSPLPPWPPGLLDSLPIGLLTVDRRLMVRSANAQGRRLLGVRREGASIGRRLLDGLSEGDRRRLRLALAARHEDTADGDGFGRSCGEVRFEAADGVPRVLRVEARAHDGQGQAVLACIDVTEARAETERAVHRADHDALTGLPNRAAIMARLDRALHQAHSASQRVAVMFIDLDRFKVLNDTHGHEAGDRLLREVAQRLHAELGDIAVPSRLGGDEFLVLLPALADGTDVAALARRAAKALSLPLELAGRTWRPSASIGVSVYPQHGEEAGALLRRADLALYRVKRQGRDGVHLYDPAQDGDGIASAIAAPGEAPRPAWDAAADTDRPAPPGQRPMEEALVGEASSGVVRPMPTLDELRAALAQHTLALHYQPQRALRDGSIVGMGALLRWKHPTHGAIAPQTLVALAEAGGLMPAIGTWAIGTAARQLQRWYRAGHRQLRLSVKLSPTQLEQPDLEPTVAAVLKQNHLPPGKLLLQVPEGALLDAPPAWFNRLETLRRYGAGLAVERFGAGAGSLALLSRLRPDSVGIDRGIVARLPDPQARSMVQAVVALSGPLSLQVVAEGVETPLQRDCLAAAGATACQGLLAGPPMPAAQATALLKG